MKVIILHGFVPEGASKDELDVLDQADAVSKALSNLGYSVERIGLSIDTKSAVEAINSRKPAFVFNLVESIDGAGRLIHIAPAILDYLKIPYTGSGTEAIFITSNKLLAKDRLLKSGISTPDWISPLDCEKREFVPGRYILKSVWEHASVGLDEDSIISIDSSDIIKNETARLCRKHGGEFFAERFVDGREFNISLLAKDGEPEVLPPAEMVFDNYPEGKNRVVGYRAKWDEESFEFKHTVRGFDFPAKDNELLHQLKDISLRCWKIFGLRGYARVDFRVDENGKPYVLEININPCISPDAGFTAATRRAGLEFNEVIKRIVDHMERIYKTT